MLDLKDEKPILKVKKKMFLVVCLLFDSVFLLHW